MLGVAAIIHVHTHASFTTHLPTTEHFAPEFKRQVPGPGSYALPSCFDLSQRKGSSFGRAPRSTALGRYKKDAIPPRELI